ncbi:YgjV family protein [Ningiella sp. W23]|uniref:YgjV family protein n=1 Tax=Ningiella sp. W23 TaxID=3023715 RepID=UPI003757CEB2
MSQAFFSSLFEALPPFDLAQAVGMVSFILGIVCFYQKDDRRLKISMVLMNVNHAIHFAMLSATTACVGALLAVVRTGISLKTSSRRVAYVFIFITLLWGASLADEWVDMLPILGSCIGTYALFCLKGIAMRVAFLFGAMCWLANNLLIGSIGTSLLEFTLIVVNISTIFRIYRHKKSQITT